MRDYIKNQLERCVIADLNNFDAETNTYLIPKYSKPRYDEGKCYLIKISKEIVNNTSHILAVNWNVGTAPRYEYYKIYINKNTGTMIKIDGLAYDPINQCDLTDMWSGWLDLDFVTLIKNL